MGVTIKINLAFIEFSELVEDPKKENGLGFGMDFIII